MTVAVTVTVTVHIMVVGFMVVRKDNVQHNVNNAYETSAPVGI